MATIWIDGKSFEVDNSKNLLEVILSQGIDLPYFCWHPAMGSVGSCRQCAIKKFRGEEQDQGQIVMACMEPAKDGLYLSVNDPEASEFREKVIEWLMLNHPHDCPICDEGGECHLQDMTVMTGHAYRRTRFKKRTYNNQDLGPCINHEMNRCIQCYRCVRFYNDYAGGDDLQVFSAHDHVYFGRHEDGTLESEFSGNLVEVCPTGVFTDKTLKEHYTRKWDLTSAPSVCQHCSLGCNILAGERYGSLRRILSRFNPDVNGYFICDRGRFGYDFVNAKDRVLEPRSASNGITAKLNQPQVFEHLKEIFKGGPVMGVGSPRASLESNYLLRALVGKENFYNGTRGSQNKIQQTAIQFMQQGPLRTPSLKEIESCDAVIVIGEDVTNTAPMIDLALNQSVRVSPMGEVGKVGIADWNDAAAREHIQEGKGPLYVLTPQRTKLDRMAAGGIRDGITGLINLVLALAHELDPELPAAESEQHQKEYLPEISAALRQARKPLIITGSSLGSPELVKASINLALALHRTNNQAMFSFVFPECNSVGVSMMEPRGLDHAINDHSGYQALVILENDIYQRGVAAAVDQFLESFSAVVVLDHTESPTTARASLVLPSGTFAEADGTLVNNEGRAQRFFSVQASSENVCESWRWLLDAGKQFDQEKFTGMHSLEDVHQLLEQEQPQFSGVSRAGLPAGFRMNGQKIPREPHRYSGRTSMFANRSVSEARPPRDEDSPLSFTMEGYRGNPTVAASAFYWSPGWNSVQSVNKFRNELSIGNQQMPTGIRLFKGENGNQFPYFEGIVTGPSQSGKWILVPLPHIFGSEEMSNKSGAILARSPGKILTLNDRQAGQLNIRQGEEVTIKLDRQEFVIVANLVADWPEDHLGIITGYPGLPFMDQQSEITLNPRRA
jgi:NADH-quinone oxidoreductase subunit G